MDADSLAALVSDIHDRIQDLPEVNTAAKLRALVGRVEKAVNDGADVAKVATQLERAALAALDADPWVLFHRAVAQLASAVRR